MAYFLEFKYIIKSKVLEKCVCVCVASLCECAQMCMCLVLEFVYTSTLVHMIWGR